MSFLDSKNQTSGIRTMQDDLTVLKKNMNEGMLPPFSPEKDGTPVASSVRPPVSSQPVNPFQSTIEKTNSVPETVSQAQSVNPFATPSPVTAPASAELKEKKVPQRNMQKWTASSFSPSEVSVREPKGKKALWIWASIFLALFLCGGVAYYFVVVRGVSDPQSAPEQPLKPAVAEEIVPKELPYALDKANYLSINTEIVSSEEIKNILLGASARISGAMITQPVEFLVTDQNNNQLAFSRFAILFKLEVNPVLLSSVDESFSLYLYNDAGKMRIGLDLLVKDPSAIASLITKGENTLPYALRTLFLEPNVSVAKTTPFKSSAYKPRLSVNNQPIAVRYANIDVVKNISIDYALQNNHWYIGTSKNTLTAILDKNVK